MLNEKLSCLHKGMTLNDMQTVLQIEASPVFEKVDDVTLNIMKFPECGVYVYFKNDIIDSVRFEAPFHETVEGVRIGFSKDDVALAKGKPNRFWPIKDGIDRWLYDRPSFTRVDFNPDTDTVRRIFR